MLVYLILVFAVFLKHKRLDFLMPQFLFVIFLPHMQFLCFSRQMGPDMLKMDYFRVELIDSVVEIL